MSFLASWLGPRCHSFCLLLQGWFSVLPVLIPFFLITEAIPGVHVLGASCRPPVITTSMAAATLRCYSQAVSHAPAIFEVNLPETSLTIFSCFPEPQALTPVTWCLC